MKMGFRSPSPKHSFSARTKGRVTRTAKKAINPLYGKKDMGYINNPQKAVYNKVYNKTTVGVNRVFGGASSVDKTTFDAQNALTRIEQLNETANIINSTTNISTFFCRFNFALEICDELKKYEYTGVIKTISPQQQKRELLEQIPKVINSLIVRCRDKAYNSAQELKTDKGRHNRIVRFYSNLALELNQYGAKYITQTNVDTINELAINDGVIDEVSINLTPVTIELPMMETPIMPAQTINNEEIQNNYNVSSGATGCIVNTIAIICASPFLLVAFLMFMLKLPFFGIMSILGFIFIMWIVNNVK